MDRSQAAVQKQKITMATKKQATIQNDQIKCGDCINVDDLHNISFDTGKPIMGRCKKRNNIAVLLSYIEKDCPFAISKLGIKNKK